VDPHYNDHTGIRYDRRVNIKLDGSYWWFEFPLMGCSLLFNDEYTACKQLFRESSLPAW